MHALQIEHTTSAVAAAAAGIISAALFMRHKKIERTRHECINSNFVKSILYSRRNKTLLMYAFALLKTVFLPFFPVCSTRWSWLICNCPCNNNVQKFEISKKEALNSRCKRVKLNAVANTIHMSHCPSSQCACHHNYEWREKLFLFHFFA